ncbi:UNVERIFIED_CONTAM: hypothetical protein FKN15_012913 [Acipenser sinensis]
MGNSESQYSVQGCKSRRLVIPGKQKPCSLRVRSVHAKDEQSRSAHSWGHASSYKTRAQARSCLSQHKSSQPYSTRHYDYVTKGSKNSANDKPRDCSPGNNFRFVPESGFFYAGYDVQSSHSTAAECNGHVENEESLSDTVEDKSSPKVLIKTLGKFDGSLRVEFTNSNNNNTLPIYDCDGPVQLLKYSPTLESTPSSSGISRRQSPSPGDSGLRTSKGSSFSSESSWYDAPWGNDAADFNDMEHPNSSSRAADTSLGDAVLQNQQRLFEQRASPISLQDLYRDASIASAFPAEKGLSPESLNAPRSKKRASLAPDVEVVSDSEGLGSMQYSSYTLPCRKSKPVVEGNAKKDTLKSRMMRISDWTGSLTRKKRKLQEPKYKEASEYFDSGIDGFTTDTSSPSQVSSLLWPPSAGHTLPPRSESSHALYSDALRQNIYENFMRELETGRCSSETETETSSDSLGSREQLDLLFQKEQGVVRKAGWLFFKPLVTLHKDKKLELAPRRKWKQYWIQQWEQNLEKFNVDLFRMRCYLASLQGGELPNPKSLLAAASRPSKLALSRLGIFSVSSFHALICSRDEATQRKRSLSQTMRGKKGLFSSLKGLDSLAKRGKEKRASVSQRIDGTANIYSAAPPGGSHWESCYDTSACVYLPDTQGVTVTVHQDLRVEDVLNLVCRVGVEGLRAGDEILSVNEKTVSTLDLGLMEPLFSQQSLMLTLRRDLLGLPSQLPPPNQSELLEEFLDKHPKQASAVKPDASSALIPNKTRREVSAPSNRTRGQRSFKPDARSALLQTGREVSAPSNQTRGQRSFKPDARSALLQTRREVSAPSNQTRGQRSFKPDARSALLQTRREVSAPSNQTRGQRSFKPDARSALLQTRREVSAPSNQTRGQRSFKPDARSALLQTRREVSAPSNQTRGQRSFKPDARSALLQTRREVSAPSNQTRATVHFECEKERFSAQALMPASGRMRLGFQGFSLVRRTKRQAAAAYTAVYKMCFMSADPGSTLYQSFQEVTAGVMEGQKEGADPPLRHSTGHMSVTERLRKVIQELVDTEKSYVKDLSCLFEIYLKPLQNETFLSQDEMESLFGSLPEMLDFQKVFLQTLEEKIASSPDFSTLETPFQFKKLLFSLGGSFLYYADHFKLYSGFCANHIKVQKVLERAKTDRAFKEFLGARNPTKQHSSTLESYLIKPVQRVLKYPLLLRELVSLTDAESEEHYHLTEAFKAMEKVASHINEMQKIYEDYGTVFDQLVAEQSGSEKEVTEISMGEFLMHSSVIWLNPFPSLGRMRKDPMITVFEAFKAMEKVASHINEMQKIYEDYGTVFDQLVAEQSGSEKEVTEISMGEFLMHSSVIWLNPFPSLGRMRKDPEVTVFVFKKAVILVYRESSKMKKKTQANSRAAFIHGDMDPFKFRWLIPLSALQVRLGNAAEAFKAMEKVASHINEMQKIYEDYGTVFDQLVAEQSGSEKEVTEISMGEFLMHSSVIWLNPFPSLGRMRKDPEVTVFVFKKAVILVYRESSKMKKKTQANSRAAFIHGDMDPFKFRWLIPLSALQVRLGNAAAGVSLFLLPQLISELIAEETCVFLTQSAVSISKVSEMGNGQFRRTEGWIHVGCEYHLFCKLRALGFWK